MFYPLSDPPPALGPGIGPAPAACVLPVQAPDQAPAHAPRIDPAAALLFIVNAASGRHDPQATRRVIEQALAEHGRRGEVLLTPPKALAATAQRAAEQALARRSAVVAVGGDGTLNAVAQAAHRVGCVMGVMPQGTFNYFGRSHGIPTDADEAARALLSGQPRPVQVGQVNDRVFLVNASLGLYPELLEDREAFKSRFGRSRLVALVAAAGTLLGRHRQLRLMIETDSGPRWVTTPTLFVGNNRLQMAQVGLPDATAALDQDLLAAVVLKPIGTWAMLGLMLRGAMGTLGESSTVDSFAVRRMVVQPRRGWAGRRVKVACDGEIGHLPSPLAFCVAPRPLWLLLAPPGEPGLSPGPPPR